MFLNVGRDIRGRGDVTVNLLTDAVVLETGIENANEASPAVVNLTCK